MQTRRPGPSHVGLGESEALGDAQPVGQAVAVRDPLTGDLSDPLAIDPAAEDAAATAELKAIGCGQTAEPTMAEQLQALHIEKNCTAEMSLHMITNRVREATSWAKGGLRPTESEMVAEAERIMASFDRSGPREYTVERDGTVRDWRRPDPTPDRGPDVGTTVHTISDDTADRRFSGAGAEDAQQQSLFLVPSDTDFHGRLYREAPELANLAEDLIAEHGFLADLANCDIRWYWKRKTGVAKGRVKIGFMKRASDLLGHFTGADFIGWLSATTCRDGKFTDEQVRAAVFHQLCHLGSDDKGNWIFVPHDFEGFAAEVRHFGTWTEGLKLGGTAFVAAHQMGLFDASDDDEDEEDDEEGEAAEAAYFDAAGAEMEAAIASGAHVPTDTSTVEVMLVDDDKAPEPDWMATDDPLADVDL